ncbi:MAG: hypothetical protein BRD48_02510 [Bacteroidetes bacterium QS_9_68_14]|nr:MAG: hypothetical protein BRD48_02510 [Bacteroidetes bacterium QS_9_68_14]
MQRIVVTGATGTAGEAVLRALLTSGHGAAAAVRKPESRAHDLTGPGALRFARDYTDVWQPA